MRLPLPLCLPLAASLLAGPLAGQAPKPALDVLPEKTLGFLLFRDPVLSQVKLQGLLQRLGATGADLDPLSEAQKAFRLPALPAGRQGLAIVYLEDPAAGPAGGEKEILYLSPPDPAAFLAKLQAVPKEKGFFEYKAGGHPYAATLRDGWVLLADGAAKGQLKRLAAAKPLRASLGGLADWMEREEAYGALTPQGLWSLFGQMKRAAAGATAGEGTAQADTFVAQAEAELSLLAFRGHLDENGNLSATIRARLNPAGAWMALGRDLPPAGDYGLAGLPAAPFTLAAGGAIPRAWMDAMVGLALKPLRQGLSAQGVADADLAPVDAAAARAGAHVQGFSLLMPSLGIQGMRMRLRVDDSRAYEEDLKAEIQALAEASRTKDLPAPPRFESQEEGGFRTFGLASDPGPAGAAVPPQEGARPAARPPRFRYVALDAQTVEAGFLAGLPAGSPSSALPGEDGIRRTAGFLPKEGTFFAFFSFSGFFRQQAQLLKQIEGALDKDLAQGLPALPAIPDGPPLGLSLRFGLDQWDLSVALPLETQLLLGRTQPALDKAQAARMKAFQAQMQRLGDKAREDGGEGAVPPPPPPGSGDRDED